MKKYILKLAILTLAIQSMNGQVTSVTVDTYYTDNGSVAGYPAGHKTFRIYANLTNATDRLTSVYGGSDAPLYINVSGDGIWNHAQGGTTANSNDCNEQASEPALEYDSFLTIGYACNDGSANTVYSLDDPNVATWMDEGFDVTPYGNGDIVVNTQVGALWFGMHNNENTQANDQLRVLVAQITTNGEICGTLNFQVFPEYAGVGSEYIEQTSFAFNSASSGDIEITAAVVPPSCFGDGNASIEITAEGGTGALSYSIDNINYSDVSLFDELSAGTYQVYVQDEAGCVALQSIEITSPQPIFATADVSDITCHDADNGSIHINHTGGTGMLVFSIDGENYIPSPDFNNLPEGIYNIHIVDVNNCSFHSQADIVLVNPDEIEATIEVGIVSCFGANDGTVLVNATGGVEPYEYNAGDGFDIENPITGLVFGNYTILVRDALGCVYTVDELAMIAQPTAIAVTGLQGINITETTAGGNTAYTVTGGIFPYTFEWTNQSGTVVSTSQNLPQLFGPNGAGTYTLSITDDMGCVYTTTITVSYNTVGISELSSVYSINVFPNPSSGLFTLKFNSTETKEVSYQITDALGKKIVAANLGRISPEFNKQIDLSEYANGVYFLQIVADNVPQTIQLVKL